MLEKVLGLAGVVGVVGALQAVGWPALLTGERRLLASVVLGLQLMAWGAVAALLQGYPSRWLPTLLAAALVGSLGQGLAWLLAGAAPELLAPAALLAVCGAVLYRLLAWPKAADAAREAEDA